MEARDFYKLASTLVSEPKSAELRTAISRAYYAIFHLAAQFLKTLGFELPKNNVHVAVQHKLHNCGDLEIARVGSQLTDLASGEFGRTMLLTTDQSRIRRRPQW